MEYVRICNGLSDKGKLVPSTELYEFITDQNKDWYKSLYYYNDLHFKSFKELGTVAGIVDVLSGNLAWDFDSEDLEEARVQTQELCARLLAHGLTPDMFTICFSGNKGFSVEIKTTSRLSPSEFKNITNNLAKGLSTRDSKIINPSRIFRMASTRHPKSGLFKLCLTLNQLSELNPDMIKKLAADHNNTLPEAWNLDKEVILPELILKLRKEEVTDQVKPIAELGELDLSAKPKNIPHCKWAILNGFFKEGNRHHCLMALGAHLKSQGFPKEVVYRMLKGAVELQEARFPTKNPIDKKQIWDTIINSIYDKSWQGKNYSCKDHDFLKEVCPVLNTPKCSITKKEKVVSIDQVSNVFLDYAANIDKNTVLTGIPALDKKCRLQTKTHSVIAGCSGSGKCLGKGTPVMMWDGRIKKVEDIRQGELLMGDDNTPRTVLSTTTGREMLYNVKQSSGDDYIVNESHILSLRCAIHRPNGNGSYTLYKKGTKLDMNVKEYLNKSNIFKRAYNGYKSIVEFNKKNLPLDPYLVGYWLGNGTKDAPQFTVHKEHTNVIAYLNNVATSYGLSMKTLVNSENSVRLDLTGLKSNTNPITKALRELEISEVKRIPFIYKTSSKEDRLRMLAGIIDSDGYLDKVNKTSYEITFKDKELLEDVKYICNTLGFRSTITEVTKSCQNNFTGTYYRMYLNGNNLNDIPVLVDYKKAIATNQSRDYTESKLEVIPLQEGEYFGFEIDGNKRFLLGDCTVTHNTTLILNILKNISANGQKALFGSLDMSDAVLYQKIAQQVSGLNDDALYRLYKTGSPKIQEINAHIADAYKNVMFDFRSGQSIEELRENLLALKEKHGDDLKLAVYDFINLISGPYSDETANLAYIAPKLKDLANEAEVLIISLAQVARAKGGPATPFRDHRIAKGSSAIEESATVLLGVWREGYNTESDNFMTVAGLKMRMGREFKLDLHWSGASSEIRELTAAEAIDLEEMRAAKEAEEEGSSSWGARKKPAWD